MKRNSFPLGALFAAVLLSGGCQQKVPLVERARTEFEPFVKRIERDLADELMKYGDDGAIASSQLTYVVNQMASVIAPVTAQVTFTFDAPMAVEHATGMVLQDGSPETKITKYLSSQEWVADYAYMNSQWVCERIAQTISDLTPIDTDQVAPEIRAEVVGFTYELRLSDVAKSDKSLVMFLRNIGE